MARFLTMWSCGASVPTRPSILYHTDTEVIVHLYEEYGERFVDYERAVRDRPGDTAAAIVLARDRTGIGRCSTRPQTTCSLPKSRRWSLCPVQRRTDFRRSPKSSLIGQRWRLARHSRRGPPPGHIMVVDESARRLHRYWDWAFPGPTPGACRGRLCGRIAHVADRRRTAAVARRRSAGAYLSGGLIDHHLIIRNCTDTPLRTFSLTFEDAEFDERVPAGTG
jgi:asparagine synthase (glutamine-hydrolysing)